MYIHTPIFTSGFKNLGGGGDESALLINEIKRKNKNTHYFYIHDDYRRRDKHTWSYAVQMNQTSYTYIHTYIYIGDMN